MNFINESGKEGHLASRLITLNNGRYSEESGDNFTVLNISLPFAYPDIETQQSSAIDTGSLRSCSKGSEKS